MAEFIPGGGSKVPVMGIVTLAGAGLVALVSLVVWLTFGAAGLAVVLLLAVTPLLLTFAIRASRRAAERRAAEHGVAELDEWLDQFPPELRYPIFQLMDPWRAAALWTAVGLGRQPNPSKGDGGAWPDLMPQLDPPPGQEPDAGAWPTPVGARVRLWIPEGHTASDYAAQVDRIASSLHIPGVRLASSMGRELCLDLQVTNPLAQAIRFPGPESTPDLQALLVGAIEDGQGYRLAIRGNHLLFSGLTGSGKSSALWSILGGLAPAIQSGLVQIHMVDLKRGMEMAAGVRLYETWATTVDDALRAGQHMINILGARADSYRKIAEETGVPVRKHVPKIGDPHHVFIVDEFMALLKIPGKRTTEIDLEVRGDDGVIRTETRKGRITELAAEQLIEILTQARAAGITLILATQNAAKEVMELLRDLIPTLVGLRQASSEQERMVFGIGARERGVRATEITLDEAGTAYMLDERGGAALRARFFHVQDDDIEGLVRDYGRPPGTKPRALAPGRPEGAPATTSTPQDSRPAPPAPSLPTVPPAPPSQRPRVTRPHQPRPRTPDTNPL